MRKLIPVMAVAALLAMGCATTMNEGDVALLAEDLKDLAREGVIYDLSQNPQHRADITRVRDAIELRSGQLSEGPITATDLLTLLRTLPIDELQSAEARLVITAVGITLRRAGRNVELGNIPNIKPLADGIVTGMSDGLNIVEEPLP